MTHYKGFATHWNAGFSCHLQSFWKIVMLFHLDLEILTGQDESVSKRVSDRMVAYNVQLHLSQDPF
jgi:hypothetical protein